MIGSALESLQDLYRTGLRKKETGFSRKKGFLSHSLSTRLIAPYKKSTPKAGAQCAPYKTIASLVIHSFDRTLQEINPKGWCAVRTLQDLIAVIIHSL